MDPIKNPFSPGAGTPPPAFTGRSDLLAAVQVTLARTVQKRSAKSMFFIGLRGVGKTVLLNHIQRLAEDDYSYQTVFIEAPENKRLPDLLVPPLLRMLNTLRARDGLTEAGRAALRALTGFAKAFKVRYQDIEISMANEAGFADSGNIDADLPVLMVAVAEAAAQAKRPVLLLIDEMQYLTADDLRALISSMHKIAQRLLPVVLVGAGLPQLVGEAGDAKSYAERLFDFPRIGALSNDDAARAIREPIRQEGADITEDAVAAIVKTTQGYPYFLQEWGAQVWNLAQSSPITHEVVERAQDGVIRKLDESFFRVRLDRLTPTEKTYLRAMAELGPGPHRSGDIAARLGKEVNAVGPVRKSLITKGMIYSPLHGDTAFTVPLFDEFMKRAVPGVLAEPGELLA